jgi:hypothetical protein
VLGLYSLKQYRYLSEESSEEAAMRAVGTKTEPPPVAGEIGDTAGADGLICAVGRGTEPDDDTIMSGWGRGGGPFTAGAVAGLWRPTAALLQKSKVFED